MGRIINKIVEILAKIFPSINESINQQKELMLQINNAQLNLNEIKEKMKNPQIKSNEQLARVLRALALVTKYRLPNNTDYFTEEETSAD